MVLTQKGVGVRMQTCLFVCLSVYLLASFRQLHAQVLDSWLSCSVSQIQLMERHRALRFGFHRQLPLLAFQALKDLIAHSCLFNVWILKSKFFLKTSEYMKQTYLSTSFGQYSQNFLIIGGVIQRQFYSFFLIYPLCMVKPKHFSKCQFEGPDYVAV